MSVITVFKFENLDEPFKIAKSLNGQKSNDSWLTAFVSKYNRNEIVVNYWFYEDLENNVKKVLDENESMEVISYLKQNGKTRVLKRIFSFVNILTKTLEIYTGSESKLDEIVEILEHVLSTKFTRVVLSSQNLQTIYSEHSTELKQVMFKNVEGLFYEILRGGNLQMNGKFQNCMEKFPENLRVISFRPKIKFFNGHNRYQVTLNGDKGTLRFSSVNEKFSWRPRVEIRQLTFLIAATLGIFSGSTQN
ncbi:MAG: hypothetical protein HYW22_02245 [Candidatus Aenigmarchaeota archaeon]|nr:hypothetical protein [Candidatus Aenigmarchaeota archaeon]